MLKSLDCVRFKFLHEHEHLFGFGVVLDVRVSHADLREHPAGLVLALRQLLVQLDRLRQQELNLRDVGSAEPPEQPHQVGAVCSFVLELAGLRADRRLAVGLVSDPGRRRDLERLDRLVDGSVADGLRVDVGRDRVLDAETRLVVALGARRNPAQSALVMVLRWSVVTDDVESSVVLVGRCRRHVVQVDVAASRSLLERVFAVALAYRTAHKRLVVRHAAVVFFGFVEQVFRVAVRRLHHDVDSARRVVRVAEL